MIFLKNDCAKKDGIELSLIIYFQSPAERNLTNTNKPLAHAAKQVILQIIFV